MTVLVWFSKHGCVKADPVGARDRPYHHHYHEPQSSSATGIAVDGSLPDCAHCKGTECLTTGCSFPMYVADGLDGPWRSIRPVMNVQTALNPLNFTGSFSISGPWIAANGTTTIILQTGDFNDVYPVELRKNNVRVLCSIIPSILRIFHHDPPPLVSLSHIVCADRRRGEG